ncbi:hypothetical protein EX30DRAFT_371015 [Ascodesmis nigricans]|uniref:Uncharacterized protein n=1 Tax=Ascodesmis nigricans TaxID=341454 RepID=A0A4S2MYJ3_9PEZI|nr:hypothetical protein EX30DRAFT_371015 [Ascodesmis nigricans]
MTSPAPEQIPLPASEATYYGNSSDALAPEPKSAVRPTPRTTRSTRTTRSSARRTPFAEIHNTLPETPAPVANVNSFKLETPYEEDEETPRPRRGRGKYHPGMRPAETPGPRTRESTVDSTVSDAPEQQTPQQSVPPQSSPRQSSPHRSSASGTESDGDAEKRWESEHSQHGEQESSDDDGNFDDMDQTVAVNFMPTLKGFPASAKSRRTTGRSSPGRTPARQLLNRDFSPDSVSNFGGFQETPRQTLRNAMDAPSLFAAVDKTPFLVAGSPQKSMYNALEETEGESWKDARIAQLEAILAAQSQDQAGEMVLDDLIEFSPEKRAVAVSENVELSVKKRRRSPVKDILGPSRSPIGRTPSRNSRSPIKSYAGILEGLDIGIVKQTDEQKRASRRRRQTQEFRDFSAINLEELKSFSRVADIIEEDEEMTELPAEEKAIEEAITAEEKGIVPIVDEPKEENSAQTEAPHDAPTEAKSEKEMSPKPEDEPIVVDASEPVVEPEYTPPPTLVRNQVRSSSCPPAPEAITPLLPSGPAVSTSATDITFHKHALQARISELEEALENARHELSQAEAIIRQQRNDLSSFETALSQAESVTLRQRTELALAERARKAAESSLEFCELEIKFGACCKYNPGWQPKEKLGPAAVALPSSPTGSVASTARPATRMARERPVSRLERPTSRFGQTRDYHRPTTSNTAATKPPAATTATTKKRVREEPAPTNGRRTPAPRPEKRVFSGPGIPGAGIVGAQQNRQTGLAKKPERVGAAGRLAATRGATGASSTTTARGLAKGARR